MVAVLEEKTREAGLLWAKKVYEEQKGDPKFALRAPAHLREHIVNEVEENLYQIANQISTARKLILSHVNVLSESDSQTVISNLIGPLDQASNKWFQGGNNAILSDEKFKNLKEFCGISDQAMRVVYGITDRLYADKKYQEAKSVMTLLIYLDPTVPVYWQALGNICLFCQEYSLSINSYVAAIFRNPNDVVNYLSIAQCYKGMKDYPQALRATDQAIEVAEYLSQMDWKNKAITFKNHLEKFFQRA